jgi:hypothetical protein
MSSAAVHVAVIPITAAKMNSAFNFNFDSSAFAFGIIGHAPQLHQQHKICMITGAGFA